MSAAGRCADPQVREPWWRVGIMWAVIGGPLVVVVAAIATAVVAWRGADPVLDTRSAGPTVRPHAMTPAHQARNHAQTAGAQSPADFRTAPDAEARSRSTAPAEEAR